MIEEKLQIRKATLDDTYSVYLLANDDVVRRNSFSQEKIELESHKRWFSGKLNSDNCLFYIAVVNDDFAGHAHLDYDAQSDSWEISIYISSKYRGMHLGKTFLEKIIAQNREKRIFSFVKVENIASNKLFLSCGFSFSETSFEKGFEVNQYFFDKKGKLNVIAISNELYDSVFDENDEKYVFIKDKQDLTVERLKRINPQYVFLPHWSYIIPKRIYENFNCVIFHMTDLPFGRGGSPLQNLISRGIYRTKISAIRCSKILDGGDVFLKKDFSLENKSAQELYQDAGYIIKDMIKEISDKKLDPIPQSGEIVSFERRTKEMSDISKLTSLTKIFDYIRMLDAPGYPYAFLQIGNFKYSFTNAKKIDGKIEAKVQIEEDKTMNKKVLIVAAHPDDEVLGCFGTVANMIKNGYEACSLILGTGKTSRGPASEEELNALKAEAETANKIIGIEKVYFSDFPDNAFDSVPLLNIVKEVEKIVEIEKPEIIFTHHIGDMNVDHQITHKAVLTATRPMVDCRVESIYAMEIPSSSEWNCFDRNTAFIPNCFFDISDSIDLKIKAMDCYKSELREYPHPRSLQHLRELAKVNGTKVGLEYSENFQLVRKIGGGYNCRVVFIPLSKTYRQVA